MKNKYCTYLTIYRGNKLPRFYIGRSNVAKVLKGYRGSVSSRQYRKIWNTELQEQPELFDTRILTLHDTAKEAAIQEEKFHKSLQVHTNPLYINQATSAGTFIYDASGAGNPWYGKSRSGKENPMYGRRHSEESKRKMSQSSQGKNSKPKSKEFKDHMRLLYQGKTLEERLGPEKAAEQKRKLRLSARNRSPEHREKLSVAAKNRPRVRCEHCGGEFTSANYKRWHGDRCKSAS